jgi:hypothetical protein
LQFHVFGIPFTRTLDDTLLFTTEADYFLSIFLALKSSLHKYYFPKKFQQNDDITESSSLKEKEYQTLLEDNMHVELTQKEEKLARILDDNEMKKGKISEITDDIDTLQNLINKMKDDLKMAGDGSEV